MARDDVIYYI